MYRSEIFHSKIAKFANTNIDNSLNRGVDFNEQLVRAFNNERLSPTLHNSKYKIHESRDVR